MIDVKEFSEATFLKNILYNHTDGLNSVFISQDGKKIVSGGWNGTIQIWNIESN